MRLDLENELELEIWLLAGTAYGSRLELMLAAALREYRRRPGFEDLTRIHLSSIGVHGFLALQRTLEASGLQVGQHYIALRSGMRWHLKRSLQQHLVRDMHATQAMRDDYFAADLGL